MKRVLLLIVSLLSTILIYAQQVDIVTLVVSGDGASKEDATHSALRSAVEQAYGVFVSANTEIFNDELIKDEIATVTSGNIRSFKELSDIILGDGRHSVTLEASVSTKKLASYAESKGASCEFAGATFGANLKLLKLNQESTQKAFENLAEQCKEMIPFIFEPRLELSHPSIDGEFTATISLFSTPATYDFCNLIYSTLKALALTESQISEAQDLRQATIHFGLRDTSPARCHLAWDSQESLWNKGQNKHGELLYFYDTPYIPRMLQSISSAMKSYLKNYEIVDNSGRRYRGQGNVDCTRVVDGGSFRCLSAMEWFYHSNSSFDFYYKWGAYNSGERIVSVPLSYIKPEKKKNKAKTVNYQSKKIGEISLEMKISPDILSTISSFNVSQKES